jgi:cytochrome d ubiquinol oxidase subunit I
LRGRRDRYHRLGFIIGFTVAAIATPVQMGVGDALARWVFDDQPGEVRLDRDGAEDQQ